MNSPAKGRLPGLSGAAYDGLMNRIRALAALFLILVLAAPASALGQGSPTLERIAERGEVRVGLTGDYKPFSWEEPEGEFRGLDVDMAEALARDLDAKLVIVRTSWPTLMEDLAAGKFDIGMGGITVTEARRQAAFFSDPILTDGKAPVARCEDKERFRTLAGIDREGVRVIVNPGGTNEQFARANITRATLVLHKDNASVFEEIAAGRADVMITDAIETRIVERDYDGLCATNPDTPFTQAEKAYLLPQDAVFKARVDDWLGRLEAIGALQGIIQNWLQ
ncbi:MAG: transporter substrate-binding domain-containing protein [Alphaproteobacteria bacterium]|nr:transporter substrate-binding domain-containing protein [Alphaproteobacteria bacterium]MDX5416422.1 transporter substrate-binding domain-containing protein [Alphaproteobacteria bacterium]MDX5493780.1 transporter substrate-binding domain-containing protein [Alphaproteobacteria bacterium]